MSSSNGCSAFCELEGHEQNHKHNGGMGKPSGSRRGSNCGQLAQQQQPQPQQPQQPVANGQMLNGGRRKSSLTYQQQLQQFSTRDDVHGLCDVQTGRYSPHPNELFVHHPAKLSIQPIDRYDDTASCCLPPPSPAPNSDRFIVDGILSGTHQAAVTTAQTQTQTINSHPHPHHNQSQHQHQHQRQLQISSSTSTTSLSTLSSCGVGLNAGVPISSLIYNSNAAVCMPRSSSPNPRLRLSTTTHRSTTDNAAAHTTPRYGSSSNFLSHTATPLVPADSYNYLSSTVHTPVKRYVPTPPPSHEQQNFTDINAQQQTNIIAVNSTKCMSAHYVNTLPYRYRYKCCAAEAQGATSQHQHQHQHHHQQHQLQQQNINDFDYQTLSMADYYATSPRNRSNETAKLSNDADTVLQDKQQQVLLSKSKGYAKSASSKSAYTALDASGTSTMTASTNTLPYGGTNCAVSNKSQHVNAVNPATLTLTCKFSNDSPSVEYMNTTLSPTNKNIGNLRSIATPAPGKNSADSNSGSTCLHCNTVRRTTGVHQTTQTTGPISPIPLSNAINFCSNTHDQNNAVQTPSTTESHISPMSPNEHTQPQQQQQQQHQYNESSSHVSSFVVLNQQHAHHAQVGTSTGQQQKQQHQMHSNDPVDKESICTAKIQQPENAARTMQQQIHQLQTQQQSLTQQHRYSCKRRLTQYLRKEISQFFGVDNATESESYGLWLGRQKRLALRRFGSFKSEIDMQPELRNTNSNETAMYNNQGHHHASDRPDILPAHDAKDNRGNLTTSATVRNYQYFYNVDFQIGDPIERKASVSTMLASALTYIMQTFTRRQPRYQRQWSRSFAPAHINNATLLLGNNVGDDNSTHDFSDVINALQDSEVFFDSAAAEQVTGVDSPPTTGNANECNTNTSNVSNIAPNMRGNEHRQLYVGERIQGWRTSAVVDMTSIQPQSAAQQQLAQASAQKLSGIRGNRISAQLLDGVLENSRRPMARKVKLFCANDLDDRTDHRPFFTYWINTVQILVLFLSLICYGVGPVGIGLEQKTGQVLVTSLSLQTVQHAEQRNVWIGPRNNDLVHMGAKFATCMRRDVKIIDVLLKTRRQERETACCIRNDDSGCVQSSQADCSVRGLYPTKSISTWKKWSPGESGPGGRISGSVCGLDPKYCDAPASIAPYEWPDDITKWPICRKTNQFSQRFRYKDHTAEHMVCEVIGHPCCTGVFGECRITTREYCDFVNGYFHEEASLCSQISCLTNVCGMFPFISVEAPDQIYRLFTSLCMHAGILHLAITVIFQHIFLADLERLIGPIRTAILYICSGIAGNLASAVLLPYKAEVGPSASLSGVVASLIVLLILIHWKHLHKPHVALFKLLMTGAFLFGIGALPWQLNFAGLLAGLICGVLLTIALVPFVSVSKYKRKAKISTIWSCIVFHMILYSFMLVVFYFFPTELTKLNFGEVFASNFNPNVNGNGIAAKDILSSSARVGITNAAIQQKNNDNSEPQYYYHHHSDDIIRNAVTASESKIQNHMQSPQQALFYQHRPMGFSLNYNNNNNNKINNNPNVTNKMYRYNFIQSHLNSNNIFNTTHFNNENIFSDFTSSNSNSNSNNNNNNNINNNNKNKNTNKMKNINNMSQRHMKNYQRHYSAFKNNANISSKSNIVVDNNISNQTEYYQNITTSHRNDTAQQQHQQQQQQEQQQTSKMSRNQDTGYSIENDRDSETDSRTVS